MGNLLRLFNALSDRNRLRIVAALKEYGDMCACQIVELLQVTGATSSKHLSVLLQAGLIDSYKEGRWVHYQLNTGNHNYEQVMGWLDEQLPKTDVVEKDKLFLKEVMATERKDLCRKQRGRNVAPEKNPLGEFGQITTTDK